MMSDTITTFFVCKIQEFGNPDLYIINSQGIYSFNLITVSLLPYLYWALHTIHLFTYLLTHISQLFYGENKTDKNQSVMSSIHHMLLNMSLYIPICLILDQIAILQIIFEKNVHECYREHLQTRGRGDSVQDSFH